MAKTGPKPIHSTPLDNTDTKPCKRCGLEKQATEFYSGKWSSGRSTECIRCHKDRRYMTSYGISLDDYESMVVAQDGRCSICGNLPGKKGLALDHDHVTGHIRELLCSNCNMALGLLKDNPGVLLNMLAYLQRYIR